MIYFSNISKTYNPGLFKKKVRAVSDLTLEVLSGEVFGLIGPNGAGKSTTIRLLLGLIRPDRGQITYRGKPLRDANLQAEIGYLPENPYLYDHLTLSELLRFCGKTSDLSNREILRRSGELLEKLDLSAAKGRPLRTFSKGMLQRAGICFALLHDPPVVILDEPMSGLDPIGRKMVFDLVIELKNAGKTVFFCSHILSDVERLCDRIGILVQGRLAGVYQQRDFSLTTDPLVHLVIVPLTKDQRERITPMVNGIVERPDEQVLSIQPGRLAEVSRNLAEVGVQVRASRSEDLTLEELFMKVVEEQRS